MARNSHVDSYRYPKAGITRSLFFSFCYYKEVKQYPLHLHQVVPSQIMASNVCQPSIALTAKEQTIVKHLNLN